MLLLLALLYPRGFSGSSTSVTVDVDPLAIFETSVNFVSFTIDTSEVSVNVRVIRLLGGPHLTIPPTRA